MKGMFNWVYRDVNGLGATEPFVGRFWLNQALDEVEGKLNAV